MLSVVKEKGWVLVLTSKRPPIRGTPYLHSQPRVFWEITRVWVGGQHWSQAECPLSAFFLCVWTSGQVDTKVQVEGQQRKALSPQNDGNPVRMLQQRPLGAASPWYSWPCTTAVSLCLTLEAASAIHRIILPQPDFEVQCLWPWSDSYAPAMKSRFLLPCRKEVPGLGICSGSERWDPLCTSTVG